MALILVGGHLPCLCSTTCRSGSLLQFSWSDTANNHNYRDHQQHIRCNSRFFPVPLSEARGSLCRSLHSVLASETGSDVSHVVCFVIDCSLRTYIFLSQGFSNPPLRIRLCPTS